MEASLLNWCRASVCDDAIFVCSCIVEAVQGEIEWPDANRRRALARTEPRFRGCIGIIDGTLCKINRPYTANASRQQRARLSRYFNGRKKIYAFNNTIVVDHEGFIIYADPGYIFEYLLGDRKLCTCRNYNS